MVGRDVQLGQQRLGVDGHFGLTGNRFFQLAAIGDQHRQGHPVELCQRDQRVDRDADGGVLHDDHRPLATHPCACAQAHALVFLVGRHVHDVGVRFDCVDHAAQLFARHGGDKGDVVGHQISDDLFGYAHGVLSVRSGLCCKVKDLAGEILGKAHVGAAGVAFHAFGAADAGGGKGHGF